MAAGDTLNFTQGPSRPHWSLNASELELRLDEEIARATRHGTPLSCLLVRLAQVDGLAETHGAQLPVEALDYLAGALGRQLRRFDRVGHAGGGELLVLLPGADERRGEIVARRALGRLRSIKLEVDGERRSLPISVGIAGWREGLSAEELVTKARRAARGGS